MKTTELEIAVEGRGTVTAIWDAPDAPAVCYVLAHGAGAGMRHAFLARVARDLVTQGIAVLRYQFPYMEQGRHRPDAPAAAHATVRAAVAAARARLDVPLVAGGKSYGGRMTSEAEAKEPLGVAGLVFLGFPLHAPGRPGSNRARHLQDVTVPMLFLQGTRDALADLVLMREVVDGLRFRATLHVIEGGDHSFKVLKRSGRTDDAAFGELVGAAAQWMRSVP